jgi:hypothetical protein
VAIVTDADLVQMRRKVASALSEVDYAKPAIGAAIQALEDWYEAARADANSDINAATDAISVPRLSNAVKKQIGGMFLAYKSRKELE